MSPSTARSARLVLVVAALCCLVVACSAKASTRVDSAAGAAATTTTAATVTTPATIPPGTTLRIGDQLDYLKTVLKLAGEDKDFPYKIEYSAFVGGPPMLQAFQAGALDTGFVGSTPLIFAQAGDQAIKAVAGWASQNGSYRLVTAPGHHDIAGWKDLKGKKVAFQQGTAGEAALLQALDGVGLKLSDITPVNLPQTQIAAALQGGSADAGLSIEPLTSVYLKANPTAAKVDVAKQITDRSSFVIATEKALDDPGRSAALADYVARVVRSFHYLQTHQQQLAYAVYVKQYGLSPAEAAAIIKENGTTSFVSLPGDIVPAQQRLADLFQAAGEIPTEVDVATEFDTRFNALVQQEQAK